jgi:hypothetical protein
MVQIKKLKVTKNLVGRYVRVYYNQGSVDGICVAVDTNQRPYSFSFFSPVADYMFGSAEEDQLIAIGPVVEIPRF